MHKPEGHEGLIVPAPHQLEVQAAIRDAREQGMPCATIEAATGVGKMMMAGLAIQDQLEHHDANGQTLFVTHRELILHHARRTFTSMLSPEVTHGDFYGDKSESGRQLTYASYQKLARKSGNRRHFERLDPEAYALGIGDESHHAAADTYQLIHEHFKPEIFLNFTATPYRHDGRDTLAVTGPIIYRKTLQEALAEGLLTKVKYKLYSDQLSTQGLLSHGLESLTMSKLNRAVFIPRRDEEIIEIIKNEVEEIEHPRGLAYCSSIEHAERMARLLSESLAFPVKAIHSGLSKSLHEEYEEGFREGSIPIATVIDQFNEGADYPDLNLLFFLRTTASETIFFHQVGRGLRTAPGKDMVTIVDLAGSINRINMILKLYESVSTLHRSRPTVPLERDPPFSFDFSYEVRDIMDVIEKVQKETQARQKELEPWRQLKVPEPLRLNLKLEGEHEESVELSPFATFCLQQIWESPTGSVDTKFLQQAHRHLFKKSIGLNAVDALLQDLEYGGVLSRSAFVVGEHKGESLRLTTLGVEKLAEQPGFQGAYKYAVRGLRKVMKGYCSEAERQGFPRPLSMALRDRDKKTFHLYDWGGVYHIGEPLNKQDLTRSDVTDEELERLYKQWQSLRYDSPKNHFVSVEYLIGKQLIQSMLKVTEHMGGAKGVSIYRSLVPGELKTLTSQLRGYPISSFSR